MRHLGRDILKYAAESENIVPILWPDAAWPDGHHGHRRLPTLLQRAEAIFAHSGDLERSIRLIMNTDSGDPEHPLALA
jgi:hypothetical protein